MTVDFTIEDLIAKVRGIASARGGVKYCPIDEDVGDEGGGCSYISGECTDDSVGCIFGQAFRELGAGDLIAEAEEFKGRTTIIHILDYMGVDASQHQKSWCSHLQAKQDQGFVWKDCVQFADNTSPLPIA